MEELIFKRHPSPPKRLGNSAKIGRFRYRLIFCSELVWLGNDLQGLCSPKERKIYILVNEDVELTLIHELFHAECFETGIRQMPAWNRNLEELSAEIASRALASYELKRRR